MRSEVPTAATMKISVLSSGIFSAEDEGSKFLQNVLLIY
jgi:hypothetical protein